MTNTLRLSQLLPSGQALVRLCQFINHGRIEGLHIVNGEPTFTPLPIVLLDVKLDQEHGPRPEAELADFALCDELKRLFDRISGMRKGRVARLEIRDGVPRRVIFESPFDALP